MTGMSEGRVRLPADIELEDRLAFGLTARQLGLLGTGAVTAYSLYLLAVQVVPLPLAAALAAPLALAGVLFALGRRDGLTGDRYVRAAVRFLRAPRRRVLAPEGIPAPPRNTPRRRPLAPLDLPVQTVLRSGLIELETGCFALVLRASSTSFALKSEEEQEAIVEAFGRFLNGVAEPLQIVVQSEPVDLDLRATALDRSAVDLDNAALRRAAQGHARFLRQLATGEHVHRREILVVLGTRARERSTAQTALERRAGEAIELLHAAGVELRRIAGDEAAALLARSLDPPGPPRGAQLAGVVRGC